MRWHPTLTGLMKAWLPLRHHPPDNPDGQPLITARLINVLVSPGNHSSLWRIYTIEWKNGNVFSVSSVRTFNHCLRVRSVVCYRAWIGRECHHRLNVFINVKNVIIFSARVTDNITPVWYINIGVKPDIVLLAKFNWKPVCSGWFGSNFASWRFGGALAAVDSSNPKLLQGGSSSRKSSSCRRVFHYKSP